MSEDENEKVVRKMIEAMYRRDIDAFFDYLSDDFTYVFASGDRTDKEGFRRYLEGVLPAFPDIKYNLERVVSQGKTAVMEVTATGTHKGEYLGMPATNKKWELPEVHILDFEAGKVKLWKGYADTQRLIQQLSE
jgi:C-1 hydroxylase